MKAFVGPRRHILFSFSKKLFALVFLVAFSMSMATPVFAQAPDFQYNFYDRWFTLFGSPSATPTREQVKTREASGLAYKGVINENSIDQLSGDLSYIYNIGLLASLDKRLLAQKDFIYKKNDAGNVIVNPKERVDFVPLSSLDIYKNAKRKAEYVFDMIADSSGAGPRGADAFVLRTTYTTVQNTERTIFTRVPNKSDEGETRVIDDNTFIIDYNSQKSEIEQQSIIVPIQFGTGENAAKPGTVAKTDFWYCGGIQEDIPEIDSGLNRRWGVGNNEDGTNPPLTTQENANKPIAERVRQEYLQPGAERVATFGSLCGGTAYYKIGQTLEYKLPTTAKQAIQEQTDNADLVQGATARTAGSNNLPACKTGTFSVNLLGCIAQVLYGLVFYPISFIAGLLGQIFDFFLAYSLSDESYRHGFIETAWRLVRDIANIFFIIIMLYTGLTAVFSTSSVSYKKVIPTLIVNALIINFSLFATRIVIDISNITARLFYNQITVTIDGSNSTATIKPISEAIVSSFNPQRIFDKVVAKEITYTVEEKDGGTQTTGGAVNFNSQQSFTQTRDDWTTADKDYAQYFILVTLMAALIMWGVAMMFWKTAFLFVGRVIQLYLSMIFSPFAFLSRGNIPLVSKISALKFDTWEGELTKAATMAPIFIFFLYIINAFLDIGFFEKATLNISEGTAAMSFLDSVIKILIPMLIVYGLISKAVSIARALSTEIGTMVQDRVGKIAGVAVGGIAAVATGGAAVAGRNIIGRLGTRIAASNTLQNTSAQGGIRGALADRVLRSGDFLSRSTFDARNVASINNRLQELGATNTRIGGLLGTNQNQTAGGFRGAVTREVQRETQRAQRFQLSEEQIAAQDAQNKAWESAYQTQRQQAEQTANNNGVVFDEVTFRQQYTQTQTNNGNPRPLSSAETNRQREAANNARLARGTWLARISRQVTNQVTTPVGAGGVAATAASTAIGGAAIAAATIVGQGAIQNSAQQQVARQRASNARPTLSPQQAQKLRDKITQLQNDLNESIQFLNTIGSTFNPPINYANINPGHIVTYQQQERGSVALIQGQIDTDQSFVDQNKNDQTKAAQVNAARARIRSNISQQNTHKENIKQAGNALREYGRIRDDISDTRSKLGE